MYFWKCWRDTRYRFLTCLLALSGFMTVLGIFASHRFSPAKADFFWKHLASTRIPLGGFFLPMAAILIAASEVQEELATGTHSFLFTRPRRRRYFVWTSWAVGMLELAVIIVVPMLCGAMAGFYHLRRITDWGFLAVFAYVLPVTAFVYGMTQLAGVLGKGARQGAAISLMLILLNFVTVKLLTVHFSVQIPQWWLYELSNSPPAGYIASLAILGWSAVSLLFPLATHWIVARRDF